MESRRFGLPWKAVSLLVPVCLFLCHSLSVWAGPDTLSLKDLLQPVATDNIFKSDDYYQWCTSIVKGEDGRYHLFYSRWKKDYTFTAWLTHSEVAHAVSETPYGPWQYKCTVLKGRGRGHWDAITAHNPKIKHFDGKYYLYYCSTNLGGKDYTERELIETARTGYRHDNWKILRPNQRTGVAVADSLDGPWQRMDAPLIEPSGPITTLTVNPAIDRGLDGRYYLIVKGDKPNETRFIRNQAIAISETPTGPFAMCPKPVIGDLDTEDMSLWYDFGRQRFYGVFHAHTFIGMVTSADGLAWEKAAEYALCPKVVELADGREIKPDRLERPFVYVERGQPKALSLAVKKGDDAYCVFIPIASDAGETIVLDAELQIQPIEQGLWLVVHRFPGACNSLLVRCDANRFVWVDTPCSNEATQQVYTWLQQTFADPNVIEINTGFHNDNLAGNGYLLAQGIPCYGSDLTPKLIAECWPQTVQKVLPYYERQENKKYRDTLLNQKLEPPNKLYPLAEGLTLQVGAETVEVHFPGPSHTVDNVVVYFRYRRLLYGGCMIKALDARNPGFTGDADMAAWPDSAQKVLDRYRHARLVVPGHGPVGDLALVRHTIDLCRQFNAQHPPAN